jgi:hypothetical protein
MVWLFTTWPELSAIVAVMLVVPAFEAVATPLPLGSPLVMVATVGFDDVQVTACVTSLEGSPFPYA